MKTLFCLQAHSFICPEEVIRWGMVPVLRGDLQCTALFMASVVWWPYVPCIAHWNEMNGPVYVYGDTYVVWLIYSAYDS